SEYCGNHGFVETESYLLYHVMNPGSDEATDQPRNQATNNTNEQPFDEISNLRVGKTGCDADAAANRHGDESRHGNGEYLRRNWILVRAIDPRVRRDFRDQPTEKRG